ncbi:Rab3 GTPase-activating protein catalytic subunit [Aphelenchoides besseyi]|nr:Rab3 GTPase-activating protein catalytic subunit [Aphelenchoides besseyi]
MIEDEGADESEIFEINDFTVVTEFERFVVQLEAILHEWNAIGTRPSALPFLKQKLQSKSKTVTFKDKEFALMFLHVDETIKEDEEEVAESTEFAYLPTAVHEMILPVFDLRSKNTVYSQYGVLEHLLLEAVDNAGRVDDENTYKDMLSALNVALLNTGCEIPFFVRIGEREREQFSGVCLNRNVRTNYEAVRTTDSLRKLGYYGGLVDLFRENVNCNASGLPPIDSVVQFDYVYNDKSESEQDSESTDDDKSKLFQLQIGEDQNTVRQVQLSVLWPRLNDETVNENEHFSDLDPYTSPRWLVDVKFDTSRKMLHSIMDELIDLHEAPYSNKPVTDYIPAIKTEPQIANALSELTHGHTSEVADINFVRRTESAEGSRLFAVEAIQRLFSNDDVIVGEMTNQTEFHAKCLNKLNSCKAAPRDSLTSRISVLLAKCLMNGENSIERFCHVWHHFVIELGNRFDEAENLPGLDVDSTPTLNSSLLHQKLQMLQFCIQTRRKNHAKLSSTNAQTTLSASTSSSEIFYDADDGEEVEQIASNDVSTPRGRLKPLNINLLKRPKETIYEPITQDKGPMTDDMIDDHAQSLASKSADDRVKEQLDVLLSDMQAFKAANPGAVIEDFIRWHSPRDWVVPDEGEPHLSERMTVPNNHWLDTWENAKPIPVSNQQRLFNDAKEAHAILQKFKDLSIRELVGLIQPNVFYNVAYLFVLKSQRVESLVADQIFEFCQRVVKAARRGDLEEFYEAYKQVSYIENRITWFESFEKMINDEVMAGDSEIEKEILQEFVLNVVRQERSVRILDAPNGGIARCIRQIMDREARSLVIPTVDEEEAPKASTPQLQLPKPHRKHYLFRWLVPRPGLGSRQVPQRMYASVGDRHFRLSGAFTDDITLI